MFLVSQHPSWVSKTVPAASGTGHTTGTATPLLRGLVWTSCTSRLVQLVQTRPRRRGVAVQVVWPVPEAAGIVFDAPDDGCCDTLETCRVVLQWINICILLHLLDFFYSHCSVAVVAIYTATRLHSMCGDPISLQLFRCATVWIPTFTKDAEVVICITLKCTEACDMWSSRVRPVQREWCFKGLK